MFQKSFKKNNLVGPQNGPKLAIKKPPKKKSNMEPEFGGLWERLGVPLERLGGVSGRHWSRLGGVLGRLGGVMERLGRLLQASWALSGASWSVLGASWGLFGASCAHVHFLGRFFNAFSTNFHWKL